MKTLEKAMASLERGKGPIYHAGFADFVLKFLGANFYLETISKEASAVQYCDERSGLWARGGCKRYLRKMIRHVLEKHAWTLGSSGEKRGPPSLAGPPPAPIARSGHPSPSRSPIPATATPR